MNVDERVRKALRDAASGRSVDEEHALQAVRARVPAVMPGVEVDPVDVEERPRRPARSLRLVALLAACVLLAGAVAIPFALRSTRTHAPTPAATASGRCGHDVTSGYRSTAVVRMPQEVPGTSGPHFKKDPVPTALGRCDKVLTSAHPRTDEIRFEADANARGDLLSLIVSTPDMEDTAGLARGWANSFAIAVRADAKRQIVEQQNQLAEKVRKLHDELRKVDTQLAKLAPRAYGDLRNIDAPNPGVPMSTNTVPPIPENGSVEVLNLAFERISILDQLTKSSTNASQLRIKRVRPDAYATVVSVSGPMHFPASSDGSRSPLVVVVIGVLAVGALLAAGGLLLHRRSRHPQ